MGAFPEEDFPVLKPEVFEFVFHHELKRAVRSQNFLTLVLLEPRCEGRDPNDAVREVARLISREIRETDLLAATPEGRLSLVLLDATLQNGLCVIARLMGHLENYQFASPLTFDVGAACCPTHGSDADTLRRVAARKSAMPLPGAGGTGSNASEI